MAQGLEVIVVDNLANASLQTLERLEFISGRYVPFVKIDIRNTPALNKVFEQNSVQAVIHTASFKSLEESVLKPLEYYNDNVSCIMSLMRHAAYRSTQSGTFIFIGYIWPFWNDLKEDQAFNYTYQTLILNQQMVEEIIRDTAKTDNEWRIAMLRLSNVAGAFENGILGEWVPPLPKNIVPLAMQVGAKQREYLELRRQAKTEDYTVERSFCM